VDAIVCASLSPDVDFPGNASLLHERLRIAPTLAFDVRNQCSGFVYALSIADQLVRTAAARRVLVVGSEVHSSGLDFQGGRGRDVTVLFGDGAGAAVVGPGDADHGLVACRLHADGRYASKLAVLGPAHKRKPRVEAALAPPENPYIYPVMEGRLVFKHAVEAMTAVIREVVADAGLAVDDVDMLLPHQANLRINQLVAMGLGIGDDRMANNIDRYGNTTAATIPILLCETMEAGRIAEGDLVCMAAFGAGFTWGAALYRW
jgi:3-oxoacyl-[acyl-carrier-protein] synthase-3